MLDSESSENSHTPIQKKKISLESPFLIESQQESPHDSDLDSQVISRLKHTPSPSTEDIKWVKKSKQDDIEIKIEKKRPREEEEDIIDEIPEKKKKKKKKKKENLEVIELSSQESEAHSPTFNFPKKKPKSQNSIKTPSLKSFSSNMSTPDFFQNAQDSNIESLSNTQKREDAKLSIELFPKEKKKAKKNSPILDEVINLDSQISDGFYEDSQYIDQKSPKNEFESSQKSQQDLESILLNETTPDSPIDIFKSNSDSDSSKIEKPKKLTFEEEAEFATQPSPKSKKKEITDLREFYNLSEECDKQEIPVEIKKKKKKKKSNQESKNDDENFEIFSKCALCLIDEKKESKDIQGYLNEKIGPIEYKSLSKLIYIHKNCALWSPEVYQNSKGEYKNLIKTVDRGRKTAQLWDVETIHVKRVFISLVH
eukprot:gene12477-6225_t